jgi:ABC-type branched-subunit amino acid transport system permease subunit
VRRGYTGWEKDYLDVKTRKSVPCEGVGDNISRNKIFAYCLAASLCGIAGYSCPWFVIFIGSVSGRFQNID